MPNENNPLPAVRLSQRLEAYLGCVDPDGVRPAEIRRWMKVRQPSVTKALRHLKNAGLIEYEPGTPVTLTPAGRLYAGELRRRDQILARFFVLVCGCSEKKARELASRTARQLPDGCLPLFDRAAEAVSRIEGYGELLSGVS